MEDIKTLLKEHSEEIKRHNKELEEDFKTHIGALREDFDDKVKLLAESASGIQEQLVAIRDMVVKNTEDTEIIKIQMMAIKSDVQIIKQNLKRKVDVEEFEALEKRIVILESKF